MSYKIEFFEDRGGRKPCLDWLKELDTPKKRVIGTALREILQEQGSNVCASPYGKQLGGGLFEFRLREDDLLFRVFCHAFGDQIVLLLSGYDKGEDPSKKRQNHEIAEARKRLTAWKLDRKQR